jgi:hypothetical protein
MRIRRVIGSIALAALAAVGCFNPPPPPPPAKLEKNQLALHLPYDLAWEAVNAVIIKNNYRVSARDPNNGIVETQVEHGEFTLKDADCGQIKGIAAAEPAEVASAVYNFYVKPTGTRTSLVTLTATFSAPVRVPFRPMQSVQCTSRGVQEARLLKELAEQAAITRRATYESPEQAAQESGQGPAASPSPAAVSASGSIRRHPESDLPAQPRGFGSTGGPHLLDMPGLPSFPQAAPALGPKATPKAAPTQ